MGENSCKCGVGQSITSPQVTPILMLIHSSLKVFADATLVFPLLVAATFAQGK